MSPTTVYDVDMAVNMMLSVNAHVWGYASEWTALCTTISKFRDYFFDNATEFQIPLSKIAELDGYIALFPVLKFGVKAIARDHNNLIDALYLVSELSNYASVVYYTNGIYVSPTLKSYYCTKYDGYYPFNAFILDPHMAWRLNSLSDPLAGKVTSEGWFLVNRHYNSARVRIKYYITQGKSGQTHISVLFLSSGAPLGIETQSVLQRGDVIIVGRADFPYTAGIHDYDTTAIVALNANITYMVVCSQDRFTDSQVVIQMNNLWVTPM